MPYCNPIDDNDRSKLRILTFTTLYPNEVMQHHGIFVEQRLRSLLASEEVIARVIAPVPWFPFKHRMFGEYARYAAVPAENFRHGIHVVYPRYPVIPKIGMAATPIFLASALFGLVKSYSVDETGFDLIDAHYLYPDGVAAMIIAARLKKPIVITARGTDVNLIPNHFLARRWIQWAARRCSMIITVSDALRKHLLGLGVRPEAVRTLRNGVDLELFRPLPNRDELRRQINFVGLTLLSVGHLIERKGHHLVIKALVDLPAARLVIVGDGPLGKELRKMATQCGVDDRVEFQGPLSHDRLVEFYNAADALVLASSREGMANVLLESIACGTPVIATPVWGSPEVVTSSSAGVLMKDRSARAVVDAVRDLDNFRPSRTEVRDYAMRFSWQNTTRGQLEIFRAAIGNR